MKSQISNLSASRKGPSLIIKEQFENQVQMMKKQVFKNFNVLRCQKHISPKQLSCLNHKCLFSTQLCCKECITCTHQHININKIVPTMNQWIFKQNDSIIEENKKLNQQWKIVSQNITYCIDIFQQLIKIIQNHLEKRIYAPQKFVYITNTVFGMFQHDSNNQSPQMCLKNWLNLQNKYHLIKEQRNKQNLHDQNNSWLNIECQSLQNEKKQRLSKANQANKKSKKFSQTALAFSQTLAELIQSKVKQQQIKSNIRQIKIKNDLNLKQLLQKVKQLQKQQNHSQKQVVFQKIKTFSLDFSDKHSMKDLQFQNIEQSLGQIKNLKNLKQLRVNTKKGKIDHKVWYHILNYVQMLKFLKDLHLNVQQKDLISLTTLFKDRQKSVRQIQGLNLQINDQKQLSIQKIIQFINTMQLRRLNLILTRNNLDQKKISQLIKKMRVYTSLSQLPLIECDINFSANKVHNDQKIQLEEQFKQKCKDVKIKSIII